MNKKVITILLLVVVLILGTIVVLKYSPVFNSLKETETSPPTSMTSSGDAKAEPVSSNK